MHYQISVRKMLFLLCIFQPEWVSGLRCYQCSTKVEGQEDCLDVKRGDEKYLLECPEDKDLSCKINSQRIDFEGISGDRDMHIIRFCGAKPVNLDMPCIYRTGYVGRMAVCTCEGEGCNESRSNSPHPIVAVLSVVLAFAASL